MQLLCGYRIAVRKAYLKTNTIRQKAKSLSDNLEQKEGEGPKAGELNTSKRWFDKFGKRFDLTKRQDNRRSSFC